MRPTTSSVLRDLLQTQHGIISRQQALACGLTPAAVDWLVLSRRWQAMRRGVYSAFTGEPSREAVLWAALHRAGAGAVLSHQTAAELFKITDRQSSLVHVTVPASRHVARCDGIVMHRSTRLAESMHPSLLPPRTRIEQTVLDLVAQAATFNPAFATACSACQRRLTTPGRLADAMNRRKKLRWRTELNVALAEISSGVHSLLEYKYVHDVERPHGLPQASRQARIVSGGRTSFLDNLYDEYRLCVELDGKEAHPDDQRWLDIRRANAVAANGITTLRYGWSDIDRRPCQTAVQVGAVLRTRGWPGPLRRCSATCDVP
jgi:hypothetical protein